MSAASFFQTTHAVRRVLPGPSHQRLMLGLENPDIAGHRCGMARARMTHISSVTAALLQLADRVRHPAMLCYTNNHWHCRAMSAALELGSRA